MNKDAYSPTDIIVYILALFFGAMILFYGYNSISSLAQTGEKAMFVKFQNDLGSKVQEISVLPGTVRIVRFSMPVMFEHVCLFDLAKPCGTDNSVLTADESTIICDSVNAKTANVFLLPLKENDFKISQIELTQSPLCINIPSGILSLKITGKGKTALVEPAE